MLSLHEIEKMSTAALETQISLLLSELHSRPDADQMYLGWTIDDVQSLRPSLTDDQARQVLKHRASRALLQQSIYL